MLKNECKSANLPANEVKVPISVPTPWLATLPLKKISLPCRPLQKSSPGPGPLVVGSSAAREHSKRAARLTNALTPSAESVMGDNMSLASGMETATSTRTRRRLFAGMKSLSVFHSRASHERTPPGHAHSRSISLPESRPLYLLAFYFLSLFCSFFWRVFRVLRPFE